MSLHPVACKSSPLVLLCGVGAENPLVCIPGAGASVTAFLEFINALGEKWPIYGLQPRGIDSAEQPHESVEDAALYNLRALAGLNLKWPIHLLGHSHGGWVAFDMALRLYEQGRPAASVTLIDTDPPVSIDETPHLRSTSEIFREFVEVFEDTFDKPLDLDQAVIASGQPRIFVDHLHAVLIRAGIFSPRHDVAMLHGTLATFTAACRCRYIPARCYANKIHLALVSAHPRRWSSIDDDRNRREINATQWRRHATELDVWHGPGHHFSILQAPHVHLLAKWWQRALQSPAAAVSI